MGVTVLVRGALHWGVVGGLVGLGGVLLGEDVQWGSEGVLGCLVYVGVGSDYHNQAVAVWDLFAST